MQDDDPDYPAVLVANRLLGGGPGSLLWQRVREKDGLSYGVGSQVNVSALEPHGILDLFAIYAPQNLARLDDSIREEYARIVREGFSAEQLKVAKTGILQRRTLSRAQDSTLVDTLTDRLDRDRTLAFDAKVERDIESLTPDRVAAVFRRYFDPSKLVIVRAGDFAKGAAK
jgi:zinc protease